MTEKNQPYQAFVVNSAVYQTLTTTKYDRRKAWTPENPKEIRSIIPGSIVEILVTPGQKLKAGEVLLTLEAMKMYNRVEIPFDGVVKEIHVAKGDKVPKNLVMITLE